MALDETRFLENLIIHTTHLDNRLTEREWEKFKFGRSHPHTMLIVSSGHFADPPEFCPPPPFSSLSTQPAISRSPPSSPPGPGVDCL